jgi:transcriptional regulator with XRE-family HTH domain
MMAGFSPMLRRRQLAAHLRELREAAGFSIKDAADGLECSSAKISRIETAQRGAIPRDVRDLCKLYGITDQAEIDRLMEMAREAKQPGLNEEFGITAGDEQMRTYIGLETAATSITEFQTSFLPGLLQTGDYARALMRGMLPRMTQEVLENRAEARIRRQELLLRQGAPTYWAVIDETIFSRQIVTGQLMRRQLDHLIEINKLTNVTIQIIPLTAGAFMGLDHPFVFFRLPELPVPDIVYIEGLTTVNYLEKPSETEPFREAIEHLHAAALDPKTSLERIIEIRDLYPD